MTTRPRWAAWALLSIIAPVAAAQTISGRVTDSAGIPIPHVRVMVRPAGDASGAALRVAITNERGEYRVTLGARGDFVVSALRLGFRPEAGKSVSVSGGDPTHFDVTMRGVPLTIATVSVTTHRVRCVPLDDPAQSADVRDWVHHAQDQIRARRAVELDYRYSVHEVRSMVLDYHTGVRSVVLDITTVREPGDSARINKEEATARAPTGATDANGGSWWRVPEEGTLLSPTFTSRLCFDDVLTPAVGGNFDVHFSQTDAHGPESTLEGTFRLTGNGMLSEIIYFVHRSGVGVRGGRPRTAEVASRVYRSVDIDGESFPLVTLERTVDDGMERRFTYSAFVRRK